MTMKKVLAITYAVFIIALFFAPVMSGAQTASQKEGAAAVKKILCAATTKAGTPCKNKAKAGATVCGVHGEKAPYTGATCGATTKAGTPCKIHVKAAGSKCHHHAATN